MRVNAVQVIIIIVAIKGAMNMAKKHPGYYLVLLIVIQILLVFSLRLLAKGESPSDSPLLNFPGCFELVDADQNFVPDHLGFSLQLTEDYLGGTIWVCGELQAMINNQWQTIDYTAKEFLETKGKKLTLYFYGGEFKRLQINGPFRLLIQIKGVNLDVSGLSSFSPSYRHQEFENSDLVLSNQGPRSTSQVENNIREWAAQQGLILGSSDTVTFTFDRWRFDFKGEAGVSPKRVWYSPTGEINWVDK